MGVICSNLYVNPVAPAVHHGVFKSVFHPATTVLLRIFHNIKGLAFFSWSNGRLAARNAQTIFTALPIGTLGPSVKAPLLEVHS